MNKPLRARRLGTGSEEHQYFVLSYRLKLVVLQPRSSFKLLMVRHHSDWCLLAGGCQCPATCLVPNTYAPILRSW